MSMMHMKSRKSNELTATDLNQNADNARFPSARYFQIHYEHIHAELLETKLAMAELQRQMADLQSYLAQSVQNPSPHEQPKKNFQAKAK